MYVCAFDTSEFVVDSEFCRLVTCPDNVVIWPDRPESVLTLLWIDDIPLVMDATLDWRDATLFVRLVRDDEMPLVVEVRLLSDVCRPATEVVRPETAVLMVPTLVLRVLTLPCREVIAVLMDVMPLLMDARSLVVVVTFFPRDEIEPVTPVRLV